MATYNHRQYNFKYPKPLVESSKNDNNRLLSPRRPQPSPSKREIMLQELGFDDPNNLTSESSGNSDLSEDELSSTIGGPSQMEYDILQKERDNLLIKTKELQDHLRQCKGQLHREEMKRQRHVKILKKAQSDILKDKDSLITNLEDIVFDGEQKIKQLEDDLKGNPIRPTVEKTPSVSSIQKWVDNVKSLHNEKSLMREQLMNLEQELEEKSIEVLNLRENQVIHPDVIMHRENSRTDNEKVVEKLKLKVSELEKLLNERNEQFGIEKQKVEIASDKLVKVEKKLKKIVDEKKKVEKENWEEIKNLRTELESQIEKIFELENKPVEVVTKTVEKVVEVESSEQKSEIGEARNKIYQLENACEATGRSLKNSKDEVKRLREQLTRYQTEISVCKSNAEDANSSHLEEESRLRKEIRQLEFDLESEKKEQGKMKKIITKEKDKVSDLEQEMQELKATLRRTKDEMMIEVECLKKKLRKQEEDLNQELKEASDAADLFKSNSEENVERLERKILQTEEKLKKSKQFNQELNTKVNEKSRKVEELEYTVGNKEETITDMQSKISNFEILLERNSRELSNVKQNLVDANDLNETLQGQVKMLSGASDVATVEMSNTKSENSKLQIELNHMKKSAEISTAKLKMMEEKEAKLNEDIKNFNKKLVTQNEENHRQLVLSEEKYEKLLKEIISSENAKVNAISSKFYKTQCSLRHILSSVHLVVKENKQLKKECVKFPSMIEDATRQAEKKITDAIAEIDDNSKELIRRYKKEMQLRKKYHNELVELKGNIRVFVRVRPPISEDGTGSQAKNAVTYDRDDDGMIYVHNSQRGRSMLFELDKVFQADSTQQEIYSEVQSLVTSCIDGYHVCIFAYGQTGSGKTYTMEGPKSDPGINQRALGDLFREIQEKSSDWTFVVSVSLVEIYNEKLKDLLNSNPTNEKLEIKMNADGSLYVPGLCCKEVKNLQDVNMLFQLGRTNRSTASTNMNEHSSRSHAVLMVNVIGSSETTSVKTFGKLNLIDLAGSERVSKSGASGDRLKEAQNINKSLSALGDVIHALGQKQSHVPFRNSKLTYMLQDSLSKDSKTLMVVQVAPVEKNVSETICSLSFAQRVRKVELGQASKKTDDGKLEDGNVTPRKSGIQQNKMQQLRKK